jgi:hypothetical protein
MTKRELINFLSRADIPENAEIWLLGSGDKGYSGVADLKHWYDNNWILRGSDD